MVKNNKTSYYKKLLNIIKKNNDYILILFFLINIFNCKNATAFGGSNSMGYGAMSPSSASSTSQFKSGISIVDPEGKSYNCQPFVDKKWDNTSFEDSWNGVYFSISGEKANFSGNILIDESATDFFSNKPSFALINENYFKNKFSGSSSSPILTLGGGMLIDRLYLASDVDVRFGSFDIEKNIKMDDYDGDNFQSKKVDAKLLYSMRTLLMFNAKIGYLTTNRLLLFLNSGIGSLSSAEVSLKSDKYKNTNSVVGDISAPIKIGFGLEYLLSNHFRFVLEASKWRVPKDFGEFSIIKNNTGSSNTMVTVTNSYSTNLNIQTIKAGILYRF